MPHTSRKKPSKAQRAKNSLKIKARAAKRRAHFAAMEARKASKKSS